MTQRRRPQALTPIKAPEKLSGVLMRGLRDALRHAPMKDSARKRLMSMGLIEDNPNGFSRLTSRGLDILQRNNAALGDTQ